MHAKIELPQTYYKLPRTTFNRLMIRPCRKSTQDENPKQGRKSDEQTSCEFMTGSFKSLVCVTSKR